MKVTLHFITLQTDSWQNTFSSVPFSGDIKIIYRFVDEAGEGAGDHGCLDVQVKLALPAVVRVGDGHGACQNNKTIASIIDAQLYVVNYCSEVRSKTAEFNSKADEMIFKTSEF